MRKIIVDVQSGKVTEEIADNNEDVVVPPEPPTLEEVLEDLIQVLIDKGVVW